MAVEFVSDDQALLAGDGPKLKYGGAVLEGTLYVPDSGGLSLEHVPVITDRGQGPWLFAVEGAHDVFASVFYLLSLADEIRGTRTDEHGRLPSANLLTVRHGLADAPWVDRWARDLVERIVSAWPRMVCGKPVYQHTATVDMDNVLHYAGRSLPRAMGATARDLLHGSFGQAAERWLVRSGLREDPYLRATEVVAGQRHTLDRAVFFYLVQGQQLHDHAASVYHAGYRRSLAEAVRCGEVGLHPSYATSSTPGALALERARLEGVLGTSVRTTRQHFLRWRLPHTLRELEAIGIVEDHTLGFADRAGFRVGTCSPFLWYDTEKERVSGIELHPFTVMDSALIDREQLPPEAVVERMCAFSDLVRDVGGRFISVWHDRYLSGHGHHAPWPAVFHQVAQHAKA